jgi:hypothetical protein
MEQRFLKYVLKSEDPSGCWIWTGGKTPNGYGMFSIGARSSGGRNAHRVAFELWKGVIPKGQ